MSLHDLHDTPISLQGSAVPSSVPWMASPSSPPAPGASPVPDPSIVMDIVPGIAVPGQRARAPLSVHQLHIFPHTSHLCVVSTCYTIAPSTTLHERDALIGAPSWAWIGLSRMDADLKLDFDPVVPGRHCPVALRRSLVDIASSILCNLCTPHSWAQCTHTGKPAATCRAGN